MAYKIKYDGSDQELMKLGYINEYGVANPDKAYELNLYFKEVEKRNIYKQDRELIDAGIVSVDGDVLDEKRLKDVELERLVHKFDNSGLLRNPGMAVHVFDKIANRFTKIKNR